MTHGQKRAHVAARRRSWAFAGLLVTSVLTSVLTACSVHVPETPDWPEPTPRVETCTYTFNDTPQTELAKCAALQFAVDPQTCAVFYGAGPENPLWSYCSGLVVTDQGVVYSDGDEAGQVYAEDCEPRIDIHQLCFAEL